MSYCRSAFIYLIYQCPLPELAPVPYAGIRVVDRVVGKYSNRHPLLRDPVPYTVSGSAFGIGVPSYTGMSRQGWYWSPIVNSAQKRGAGILSPLCAVFHYRGMA